ncbi:MAG: phenylalanine--tRNA ligase subunit alpha [Rhodothermales bacterium]|nr:phenylalanine--tRNA ligase subunit alpha [Rhodothermales bacterium]
MVEQLDQLRRDIEATALDTSEAIDTFRIQYLGRKSGRITDLFQGLKDVPPAEKPAMGHRINAIKVLAEERLEAALQQLKAAAAPSTANLDITLPGRQVPLGSDHPLTQTLWEIQRIFAHFGFDIALGPEIEDDWHNFTALNFPPDHPARDMQDPFFLREGRRDGDAVVLRTHTSPVQIRVMERQKPPIRVIVPGRVYRNESITYKSYCLFHQVEGLYVDEGVTLADLKQILNLFARAIFGNDVVTRLRPSFFPFTEPSAELDIWWRNPALPGGGRWMEILGSGMVDPNVLESVGIDSERYTGYAFGMGVERIAMLRYNIQDIRVFYENDIRFLEQF